MPPSLEAMCEIALDMLQGHTPPAEPGLNNVQDLISEGGIYAVLSLAIPWAEVIRQTRTDHTTLDEAIDQPPTSPHCHPVALSRAAPERRIRLAAAQFVNAWCTGCYDDVLLIAIDTLVLTDSDTVAAEFLTAIYVQAHPCLQHPRPSTL